MNRRSNVGAGKRKIKGSVLRRLMGMLFRYYPVMLPLSIFCIIFTAVSSSIPNIFLQQVIAEIENFQVSGMGWEAARDVIVPKVLLLIGFYVLSIVSITVESQLMAVITQGFLDRMRKTMFDGMQNLPIKYFDTHKHGDIMSFYTNDIDTLRMLVSQVLPTLIRATVIVVSVLFIMLYYSVWMTLVLMVGVAFMILVSKKVGGGASKYFLRMQKSVAVQEGFVQEMMNGQKVIKVFCYEEACKSDFEKINDSLREDTYIANAHANILGPVIMNIGNLMYVILAMVGGLFLISDVPNISISGMAF